MSYFITIFDVKGTLTEGKYMIKLLAVDLDGTLLKNDKSISNADFLSLAHLGENGIYRIAATGRNMQKVQDVIPDNTPLDYIVFSSGGGIYDWKMGAILVHEYFQEDISQQVCNFLLKKDLNFLVFQPIPYNHLFEYHNGAGKCSEFDNYIERHLPDCSKLNPERLPDTSGQFMVIIPHEEVLFESIKSELELECAGIKVIRTTSPVDSEFIWIEIFPDPVSKGHGLKWLCDFLSVPYSETAGIGNDYNDLDMLEFVAYPCVMGNSPASLLESYPSVTATNNQNGFSEIVKKFGL